MQAPKIEKIVLNMGVGDAVSNSNLQEEIPKPFRQMAHQPLD
jgi:large subunit ribosomal protein L5